MIVRKISFENYKAFGKGVLELRPITILLGANSVGKSSIIQLILMLKQTALLESSKSSLKLHGESTSLGENENIFQNRDTSKSIKFGFEFLDRNLMDLLKVDLFNDFTNRISQPIQYIEHSYINPVLQKKMNINLDPFLYKRGGGVKKSIFQSKEKFINLINEIDKLSNELKKSRSTDFYYYYLRNILNKENALESQEAMFDFLSNVKKYIKNDSFTVRFEIQNHKFNDENVLKLSSLELIPQNSEKKILHIWFSINKLGFYNNLEIKSDFTDGQLLNKKDKEELLSLINQNSTIFTLFTYTNKYRDVFIGVNDEEYSIVTRTILQIISTATECVRKQFYKGLINHVSPLRAHPKRYYFLDKANVNTVLDSFDGNSLTEILLENEVIKRKVNDWLSNFGLKIDVNTIQDVIHKLKVNQHNLDLDITDVGFGISQILPIIVQGFLSFDHSLTMIEQPEIHLHPKMQADLADLFIDIVKAETGTKKYLLIETHSEYLLRRLRRRISERHKGILSKDIAIYFIHPKNSDEGSAIIEEKNVSDSGFFEWPKDFYSGELLKDTTEFIKQQTKK
ncbi:MAG: AAA family ATPase [Prevotella sp.]|jgi:predicted ATPase|nr:AAA family ATPase [Prevotella sp.]